MATATEIHGGVDVCLGSREFFHEIPECGRPMAKVVFYGPRTAWGEVGGVDPDELRRLLRRDWSINHWRRVSDNVWAKRIA